jgi:DNA polymerase-3 subunit alpha
MSINIPHLHSHSAYSVLDGIPSPEEYLKACDDKNITAIAATEHGTMASHAHYSVEAPKHKTKVILGLEAYVIDSVSKMNKLRTSSDDKDKEILKEYRSSFHVVLLAKNEIGYKNLIKINNDSWINNFYYKNRTDFKAIEECREGLVCLSGCMSGIVSKLLLQGKKKSAKKVAKNMKRVFGDDFYLELQMLDMEEQSKANRLLIDLGNQLGIGHVLTNDVHFIDKKDYQVQKMLLTMQTKGALEFGTSVNYLKTLKDFENDLKNHKEISKSVFIKSIDNVFKIADNCNYNISTGGLYFPEFDHKTHPLYYKYPIKNKNKFFRKIILHGAKLRLGERLKEKIYQERLSKEYNILFKLGGIDYFLIVDDLLDYVRKNGAFSVIRGSANGSLIAFCLGFGLIDPIRHGIMFERFVSEHRSLNDIDIDIDIRSEFRSKAIDYLKNKYGDDRVISVGTFNRMQLKGSVKDVIKIFRERCEKKLKAGVNPKKAIILKDKIEKKYSFKTINGITHSMFDNLPLDKAREEYPKFDDWCNKNKKIVETYISPLVGNIRAVGIHAAGVVITPNHVNELLPVRTQADNKNKGERMIATEWENSHTGREDLNEVGVMALDILGVRTLSIISETLDLINKNKKKSLDLYNLDLNDKKTMDAFKDEDLLGVFQFTGTSTARVVHSMNENDFDFNDLIAIVALSRPGALSAGADHDYGKRKMGMKKVSYDHHSLKNVLNDSRGVLVFSEHILRTASEFAGMSPKEADGLRKIIKSKIPGLFETYKKKFLKGARKKWKSEKNIKEVSRKIWRKFSKAGSYLFPRGHAASYALIGYLCQYLKVNYPIEFFSCLLTFTPEPEKHGAIISLAIKKYNIDFKPPSVNYPEIKYSVISDLSGKEYIRKPLNALKGVGDKAVESILENAPFTSMEDFFNKVNKRVVNKGVVEKLIITGCFNEFGKRKEVYKLYRNLRKDKGDPSPMFETIKTMNRFADSIYGYETISILDQCKKFIKKKGIKKINSREDLAVNTNPDKFFTLIGKFKKMYRHPPGNPPMRQVAFVTFTIDGEEVGIVLLGAALVWFLENHSEKYFVKDDLYIFRGKKNIYGKTKRDDQLSFEVYKSKNKWKPKSGFWIKRVE